MKSNYPRSEVASEERKTPRFWLSAAVLTWLIISLFGFYMNDRSFESSFHHWRVSPIQSYLNPFFMVFFALAGIVFWRSHSWKFRHKLLMTGLATLGYMGSIVFRAADEIDPVSLIAITYKAILEESLLMFLGLMVVATPVWLIAAVCNRILRSRSAQLASVPLMLDIPEGMSVPVSVRRRASEAEVVESRA